MNATHSTAIARLELKIEQDIVHTRQRARLIAEVLGFSAQDQTRISTAVSEIARNAHHYGGGGVVEFSIAGTPPSERLEVIVRDQGPGIARLDEILEGRYASRTGMGLGIMGSRKLLSPHFHVETRSGQGTTVIMGKELPRGAAPVTPALFARLSEALVRARSDSPLEEIRTQNHELIVALELVHEQEDQLKRFNRELTETNAGIVALNSDLAKKTERLEETEKQLRALLKETHHRVKNNLALVVSLMRISAGRSAEVETKAVLKEMQTRVQSVILLNETLYKTESYTHVNLGDYLKQIATHAFQVLNVRPRDLRLVLDLEPVEALTSQAIPCGLIVNELITNSLKHAFSDGRGGEVRVALHQAPGGEVLLCVSDSGAGLPRDFETRRGNSLGLQLVTDLARQVSGRLEIGAGPGAVFTVLFPLNPRPRSSLDKSPVGEDSGGPHRFGWSAQAWPWATEAVSPGLRDCFTPFRNDGTFAMAQGQASR